MGTITLSPAIELENLLPFDFEYRVYDQDGKYDFNGSLPAGQMTPLHGVNVKHVIGLSLEINEQNLKTKQVALINNGKSSVVGIGPSEDRMLLMIDNNNIQANVFIDYE